MKRISIKRSPLLAIMAAMMSVAAITVRPEWPIQHEQNVGESINPT